MNKILTVTLTAMLGLGWIATAKADSTQVLVETTRDLSQRHGPVRGAIGLARPAGRAAVAVGRAVKPARRAAWLARATGRGIGKAARGIGRLAKFGKVFRPFKKRIIVP